MFHYDRGLKLDKADLAIDFQRRQPRGFISHAHRDHMAAHATALCTPATGQLYRHILGNRPTMELAYRQPLEWAGMRLTTYPAGHCLGSAMLLAEDGGRALLYTGDFKLGASATAEMAELPRADVLVMECTFGNPRYRMPPRADVIEQFIEQVRRLLADGVTPVVEAYALGKGQEVTKLLTDVGIPVLQHPKMAAISRIYEACGVDLGDYAPYPGYVKPGHAIVTPPLSHRYGRLPGLKKTASIAVTGWAVDPKTRYRLKVDHAFPLSDHADYDELFQTVERVGAQEIYCTHGPDAFADRLRDAGFNAFPLAPSKASKNNQNGTQRRLF